MHHLPAIFTALPFFHHQQQLRLGKDHDGCWERWADGWLVGDGMRLAWLYIIDAIAGRYYRS